MPQRTLILTPQFEINFLPLIICQGSETQLAIKDIQSTGAQTFAKGEIGAVSLMSEIEGIDRVKAEMGFDHRTKFVIGQDEYKYFKISTMENNHFYHNKMLYSNQVKSITKRE